MIVFEVRQGKITFETSGTIVSYLQVGQFLAPNIEHQELRLSVAQVLELNFQTEFE